MRRNLLKEENGVGSGAEGGPVMLGMMESAEHSTVSMTMCVQGVMETTRGRCAQLSQNKRGETIEG